MTAATSASRPPTQPPAEAVFALDDIPDGGAREAVVAGSHGPLTVFVVRLGQKVHGYVNHCPHRGVPLNWKPDTFLDEDGRVIVCAMHGAEFRIEDGACLAGPCRGQSLTPARVDFRNGKVVVRGT